MQLVLFLGTLEWGRTLLVLVEERQTLNQPWTKMGIILGVVALFTLLSTIVFNNKVLKERYKYQADNIRIK